MNVNKGKTERNQAKVGENESVSESEWREKREECKKLEKEEAKNRY